MDSIEFHIGCYRDFLRTDQKSLNTAEHVLSNNDRFQSHFCDVVFTYPPPSAKGERELGNGPQRKKIRTYSSNVT